MASQQQNVVLRGNNMRELWSTEFQDPWEPFEIKCTVLQVLHYVHFVFACPALLFFFFFFFQKNVCTFLWRAALVGIHMVPTAFKLREFLRVGQVTKAWPITVAYSPFNQ